MNGRVFEKGGKGGPRQLVVRVGGTDDAPLYEALDIGDNGVVLATINRPLPAAELAEYLAGGGWTDIGHAGEVYRE